MITGLNCKAESNTRARKFPISSCQNRLRRLNFDLERN
jgi:hypothetical protein